MADFPLRVLVAEDDPAHAEAIRRAFRTGSERAQVYVAGSLGELRAAVATNPPDIALLDLNLPDGRAVEVLTSPAEDGAFPVLIMTSFGDEQVAVSAMKAGALDYIVKSAESLSTMPRIVDRALREWSLLRARRNDEARIKHLNSVLRGIRHVYGLITKGRERDPLLSEACERLVESMGYRRVWVATRGEAGLSLTAHAGLPPERAAALRVRLARAEVPRCVERILTGRELMSQETSCQICGDCELASVDADCGVLVARMEHRDAVYGVMAAAVPREFVFDKEEQALFQELVADLSFAIYRLDLEGQHETAEDALARSEARYRDLVENIEDVVFSTDADGKMVYVSPAVQRVFGYAPDELLGHGLGDLVHLDDLSTVRTSLLRMLEGSGEPCEARWLDKGRRVHHVRLTGRVRRDHGVALGLNGLVIDITEQVKASREKQYLEEQLGVAQRLEAVGRLAGGIAHDFNNLLSVIVSFASFAADAVPASDPVSADIAEIQNAAQRAAVLTRQLLAFSRKQVLEPRVLDLNDVVSGIESMLRRLLGEDIEIDVRLTKDASWVMADPGQLEQVIMNLAVNARDAMPRGGKLLMVTSAAEIADGRIREHPGVRPGSFVVLSVADTGTGMDVTTKEHIFEPFFTTKEKGKGTGLGLSTVYGIVKQSGGDIRVYSEPGRGTTFEVYLPRVLDPPGETRRKTVPILATGHETVLIVEDEDGVRKLAERILQNAGYRVLVAAIGHEALQLGRTHGGAIDLLLTDVIMPQMSGRELAERMAQQRPELKVLYMSGYTDDAIVHHGVLEPGVRFIGKPFAADELTRKVREVLEEAQPDGG